MCRRRAPTANRPVRRAVAVPEEPEAPEPQVPEPQVPAEPAVFLLSPRPVPQEPDRDTVAKWIWLLMRLRKCRMAQRLFNHYGEVCKSMGGELRARLALADQKPKRRRPNTYNRCAHSATPPNLKTGGLGDLRIGGLEDQRG